MNRLLLLFLSAALAAPLAAQDAPKPAAKKKGGAPAHNAPPAPDPELKAIEKTVREYVHDQAEEEGTFTVEDDVLARSWDAKLQMLRPETLRRPAAGKAVVCVVFKGEDAENSQPLDLDFSLSNDGESWTVDDIVIHSVSGKERFSYNRKGERVPVKGPKKGKAAQAPAGDASGE